MTLSLSVPQVDDTYYTLYPLLDRCFSIGLESHATFKTLMNWLSTGVYIC